MNYEFKYKIFYGLNPHSKPITKIVIINFENKDLIYSWISENMLPNSIWWIEYQILCDGFLVEEKRNPNLDENLRSR